jgi:hypothetical protein
VRQRFFLFFVLRSADSSKLVLALCRYRTGSFESLIRLCNVGARGLGSFRLSLLNLLLPALFRGAELELVGLLFTFGFFFERKHPLFDSLLLDNFFAQPLNFLFLFFLGLKRLLDLRKFFWVDSPLHDSPFSHLVFGCEAWNLQLFCLVFQRVHIHVVHVGGRKLGLRIIYALLHDSCDSFADDHFV